MPARRIPSTIIGETAYCGGCGHGVIQRLIAEALDELDLACSVINVVDIACCFWSLDTLDFDGIAGPHGRCAAVATAVKKARPDTTVFVHAGDGASYSIGFLETTYAALRDIPITMIVVNNGNFGMTGGQMSPATTMLGQRTTSSPRGRERALHGGPADFLRTLASYDIAFAARGALYNVKEINTTKSYIKKGFVNQRENKGFSVIEVLSPCPTNWGLSAVDANARLRDDIAEFFAPGIYTDRGGE